MLGVNRCKFWTRKTKKLVNVVKGNEDSSKVKA